jgi:hypothetical protein
LRIALARATAAEFLPRQLTGIGNHAGGTPFSRFIAADRPDQQGRFRVGGLPGGRYLVTAVDYLETGTERDPELLTRLRERAVLLTLEEGETKDIDLKLVLNY